MASDPTEAAHPFPPTLWGLVRDVGRSTSDGQRAALDQLLQRYLPALRTHLLLERRLPSHRVDDLLQGFVSRKVLEQRILRRLDPDRGRFRTFLLRTLNNYVTDELRAERVRAFAAGRGGGGDDGPEGGTGVEIADQAGGPTDAFDAAWAREVLAAAVETVRAECASSGRPDVWGVFEYRVLRPSLDGSEPMPYDELVARHGLQSPAQASNVLMTAKRMFARALRGAVGEYAEADQIDDELRDLKTIFARGRPRA